MKQILLFTMILGFAKSSLGVELYEISVNIQTPTPCYSMLISDVYTDGQRSLVIAQIIPPPIGTSCISMIGRTRAQINLAVKLATKTDYAVLGKSWCWEDTSGESTLPIYPSSIEDLDELKTGLTQVFSQTIPKRFLPSPKEQWNTCDTNKH